MDNIRVYREWLLEIAAYYRPMGFFANPNLSDYEIVEGILELLSDESKFFQTSSNPWREINVLMLDQARFIWMDVELSEFGQQVETYSNFLKALSKISRGVFMPTNILEEWQEDETHSWTQRVSVEFNFNGKRIKLWVEQVSDYIDVTIMDKINELINLSGIQFEDLNTQDQIALIVALTHEEKERLKNERGWQFSRL